MVGVFRGEFLAEKPKLVRYARTRAGARSKHMSMSDYYTELLTVYTIELSRPMMLVLL